jgi:hypothetical protein
VKAAVISEVPGVRLLSPAHDITSCQSGGLVSMVCPFMHQYLTTGLENWKGRIILYEAETLSTKFYLY